MDEFWQHLISTLGRNVLFVDTGAILCYFETGNKKFRDFFDKSVGYQFVTSTYVVVETVRRLVKSDTPHKFVGPKGEQSKELTLHILREWLDNHDVHVICLQQEHFDEARAQYCVDWTHKCDLNDAISAMIVRSLEQEEIASPDHADFGKFGIRCLP